MTLPFSQSEFLDVFGSFNQALWPAAALLWVVTAALAAAWAFGRLRSGRWFGALLALHWAWAGIAYHLAFFSRINPAARVFGALFVVQAAAFVWWALARPSLSFPLPASAWRRFASAALVVYALAYPFLGFLSGLRFPRVPTFGVPCPTTLLTAGILLAAVPRAPRVLLIIPFLWCLVAGSAASLLGIRADLALPLAALALLADALVPRRTPLARAA